MITKDSNFKKLYETDKFVVGHVFEYSWLVNKANKKEI